MSRALLMGVTMLLAFWAGCQQLHFESRLMKKQEAEGAHYKKTAAEVRIYIDELAGVFPGTIEDAADRIIVGSTDARIKRHALLWKINGIPTAFRALFHPDPAVGVIDTWAFSMQMADYFDHGPGNNDFGRWRDIALDASRRLEIRITRMIASGLPEDRVIQLREQIHSWVLGHLIERDFTHRDTTVPELATIIGDQSMDTLQTIGSLAVGIEELTDQLTTSINFLAKQARWQAELLLIDTTTHPDIHEGLASVIELADSANRVAPTLERLPDWLGRERKAISATLRQERIDTLAAIDQQRMATLTELEAAGSRIAESTLRQSEQLIDHLFVRLLQLLGIVLVAGGIAAVWLRRGSSNRRPTAG